MHVSYFGVSRVDGRYIMRAKAVSRWADPRLANLEQAGIPMFSKKQNMIFKFPVFLGTHSSSSTRSDYCLF